MKLPKYLLVVSVEIDPGVERDWNAWYDRVHLPEIVNCPGFRRAARYVSDSSEGRKYVSLYDLESEEAIETVEFNSRRGWAQFGSKIRSSVNVFKQITYMESES